MTIRHYLEVDDLTAVELTAVLDLAAEPDPPQVLAGAGAALVFEKPSSRTRHSTEMAVVQLGGHPVYTKGEEIGIDTRETAEDVARVLGRYHSVIAARVFEHSKLERMAAVSPVPIVNLLSDDAHPCQALADLLTIRQVVGRLEGVTLAFVGDGNNVLRSLALGAALAGLKVRIGCPPGFEPSDVDVDRIRAAGGEPLITNRAEEAVAGADVVYTDVWASMGQETQAAGRMRAFEGFSVDVRLMAAAGANAVFLHCLPAHRGEEVSAEVLEGESSHVWLQAENRMHSMRGLIAFLLSQ